MADAWRANPACISSGSLATGLILNGLYKRTTTLQAHEHDDAHLAAHDHLFNANHSSCALVGAGGA